MTDQESQNLPDYLLPREGDPDWLARYLTVLRAGRTIGISAAHAGVSRSTVDRWRKESAENEERHTRAKRDGKVRALDLCRHCLVTGAQKGSTWHLARLYALCAPNEWARINQRIGNAEPGARSLHVTSGEHGRQQSSDLDDEIESVAKRLMERISDGDTE